MSIGLYCEFSYLSFLRQHRSDFAKIDSMLFDYLMASVAQKLVDLAQTEVILGAQYVQNY